MLNNIGNSLLEKGINWKFPDSYGLCERNLDCRQLSIKEILGLKGETKLIRVFLNAFDCKSNDILLRRKEPILGKGWSLKKYDYPDVNSFKKGIEEVYGENGYSLIYFDTLNVSITEYYKLHDVIHWSLVVKISNDCVNIIDDIGIRKYFQRNVGTIPAKIFFNSLKESDTIGTSYLECTNPINSWEEDFEKLLRESVENMLYYGGIDSLEQFILSVGKTPREKLVSRLEQLEFDINYYRKLRELWKLAVIQKEVPKSFFHSEWVEELWTICNLWSLVLGVLMKWKRQSDRDYKDKLNYNLEKVLLHEYKFYNNLRHMIC